MKLWASHQKVLDRVKAVVRQGNVNRVSVKNSGGDVVFTMPVTFAVVCGVCSPFLIGLSMVLVVVKDCTIHFEYKDS
jgi:hypothetical protein